ncbi:MAG: response regulator [Polyangiaceae bacterium]|jgi:CheY-like chemotaxis protein|nr:response regulator [Polyangiaceae bacterium]
MADEPRKVLVVDDDEDLRESLTALLTLEGFSVEGVCNGREALDYLRTHAPPCVIVLDLMMPVMSGAEFRAEQLRDDALASIPVFVLSASHDGRKQAETMRASGYFPKPLPLEAFFESLRASC